MNVCSNVLGRKITLSIVQICEFPIKVLITSNEVRITSSLDKQLRIIKLKLYNTPTRAYTVKNGV